MSICEDALEDPDQLYVLIIDEINRGDPARIFGELLYALEYRGREVLLAGGGALTVPTNLVLLGTMNSVDRSVGMIDYALPRRFAFVRVDSTPSLISKAHGTKASIVAAEALANLNRAIRELGDPELQLGHSLPRGPIVIETKYATAFSKKHLYQVLAYMKMVDSDFGLLVYPKGAQLSTRCFRGQGSREWHVIVTNLGQYGSDGWDVKRFASSAQSLEGCSRIRHMRRHCNVGFPSDDVAPAPA